MNFSEYIAILSGNTDLLEKAKIEKRIAILESEKHSFYKEKLSAKSKYGIFENDLNSSKKILESLKIDQSKYEKLPISVERDIDSSFLTINNKKLRDIEQIGKLVIGLNNINTKGETQTHGTIGQFEIQMKTSVNPENNQILNKFYAKGELSYLYSNGLIITDNPKTAVRYFVHALDRIPNLVKEYEKKVDNLKNDMIVIDKIIKTEWSNEEQLKNEKDNLKKIEKKIYSSLDQENKKLTNNPQDPHEVKEPTMKSSINL